MTAVSARYGRGTAGLATAAVAALSASALAGLVWLGADEVLGRAAGSGGGLLGDLGLAPAQVDLGHPTAHRAPPAPPSAPASPPTRAAGLTRATTSRGATPLVPVTTPGVPSTTAGAGTPGAGTPSPGDPGTGNGNGQGRGTEGGQGNGGGQPSGGTDGGQGSGRSPQVHGAGGAADTLGRRWVEQLALVHPGDLAAAIAAQLPGVGSVPSAGSPRSDRAVQSAQNRLAWALARAELKSGVVMVATGTATTTGDVTTARPHGRHAASQHPTSRLTAHPQVTVSRGHATPPGHAAVPAHGHPAGTGTTPHAGTADGGGSHGHGPTGYAGKHRRG